jgi:tetratricopeptide (TPR) repeat protein
VTTPDPCIDLEVLSSFTEGTLDRDSIPTVTRHLSRCAACRLTVERAVEIEDDEERWSSSKMAIAAGVILVVAATSFLLYQSRFWEKPDQITLMAAAASSTERSVEPRLSGGFRWAPYRNMMAGVESKSSGALVARGIAGKVLRDLKNDESADALHARGIAYLLQDDAAAAVPLLRLSARLGPGDARGWNDLAAALYVKASSDGEMHEALAAARQATRLDPGLIEAYFNAALVLERIGTKREIRAAWIEYLQRDPSGGWSEEARDRLAHYEERK